MSQPPYYPNNGGYPSGGGYPHPQVYYASAPSAPPAQYYTPQQQQQYYQPAPGQYQQVPQQYYQQPQQSQSPYGYSQPQPQYAYQQPQQQLMYQAPPASPPVYAAPALQRQPSYPDGRYLEQPVKFQAPPVYQQGQGNYSGANHYAKPDAAALLPKEKIPNRWLLNRNNDYILYAIPIAEYLRPMSPASSIFLRPKDVEYQSEFSSFRAFDALLVALTPGFVEHLRNRSDENISVPERDMVPVCAIRTNFKSSFSAVVCGASFEMAHGEVKEAEADFKVKRWPNNMDFYVSVTLPGGRDTTVVVDPPAFSATMLPGTPQSYSSLERKDWKPLIRLRHGGDKELFVTSERHLALIDIVRPEFFEGSWELVESALIHLMYFYDLRKREQRKR
ncbi:hypothetical protein BJ742DRAFT_816593 [Cladochytrium replicatum]|nr:hypothetical protein BJ742DRAFT_816593 [Cladochytrium replicatum]